MKVLGRNIGYTITPIVGYGLVGLLVIFGFLCLEKYVEIIRKSGEDVRSLQSEYVIMEQIKDAPLWEARLTNSIKLRQKIDTQVWSGTTSGLIAAELTQTLYGIAKVLDISDVTVRVDSEPTDIDAVSYTHLTLPTICSV